MPRQLLCVELNEFNRQLLEEAAESLNLTHVKKLIALPYESKIVTEDLYDSGFLEPWVQWVSVHTGVPSTEHKIKHLGDVTLLKHDQIWERLHDQGVTSGIWGAMNATRGRAECCHFFLPDPWTFSEVAVPKEVNNLLDFPRYLARNYLRPNLVLVLKHFMKFAAFACHWDVLKKVLPCLIEFLVYAVRFKAAHFVTYSLAEYVSTIRFFHYRKKFQPQYSSLFLNLIAHAQHYYWYEGPVSKNPRLKYTFKMLDRILGTVFSEIGSDTDVVVTNALSQMNTSHEPAWILYRQKDHGSFLRALGIRFERVEACMTHDAHIYFSSPADRASAEVLLKSVVVNQKPMFSVESYPDQPNKLFYMIVYTDDCGPETVMSGNAKDLKFGDHFVAIVRRTAKHINAATVFASADIFPRKPFYNHEMAPRMIDHLLKER
jgi:hypothetical protein